MDDTRKNIPQMNEDVAKSTALIMQHIQYIEGWLHNGKITLWRAAWMHHSIPLVV